MHLIKVIHYIHLDYTHLFHSTRPPTQPRNAITADPSLPHHHRVPTCAPTASRCVQCGQSDRHESYLAHLPDLGSPEYVLRVLQVKKVQFTSYDLASDEDAKKLWRRKAPLG